MYKPTVFGLDMAIGCSGPCLVWDEDLSRTVGGGRQAGFGTWIGAAVATATATATVTKTWLLGLGKRRYHHRLVSDCIEIVFGFCGKVNRLIDKSVRQHRRWIRSKIQQPFTVSIMYMAKSDLVYAGQLFYFLVGHFELLTEGPTQCTCAYVCVLCKVLVLLVQLTHLDTRKHMFYSA